MRKLQFTAHPQSTSHARPSLNTQAYVTDLLSKQLSQYGFETTVHQPEQNQVQVNVENRTLPLSVSCQKRDEQGRLVCEISAYPQNEQDWFSKIETQSVIKQLAQAVENSLRTDENFSEFEWKG